MPPRIFIVVVCFLLALLHAYIGWRILPDLPLPVAYSIAGAVWLALSFVLVPMGLLSRTIKSQPLSDRLAWAGMLAMGFFSSLLVLTLVRDIAFVVADVFKFSNPLFIGLSALAVPVLAFVVSLIGFVNARRIAEVREVDVPIAGLPYALHGFSIAQISDIHVGPTIKRGYLAAIVNKVNRLKPDMVAVTGDLVDGSVAQLRSHTEPLAELSARYGAFFVTGNHEYYSNAHEWIAEVKRLGLTVLMNEHVLLRHDHATMLVAGVPDYTAHHFDESHRSNPRAALKGAPSQIAVKILLAHQPRTAEAAADAIHMADNFSRGISSCPCSSRLRQA
jgi:predicted MPP superfamily phosphohydrolase